MEPDEIIKVNNFAESQAAIYFEKYQEYKRIGLTPEQLLEVDRMYAEKCREVAGLRKQIRLQEEPEETTDWKMEKAHRRQVL